MKLKHGTRTDRYGKCVMALPVNIAGLPEANESPMDKRDIKAPSFSERLPFIIKAELHRSAEATS